MIGVKWFRSIYELQSEICFVGWLWDIKECNGFARFRKYKDKKDGYINAIAYGIGVETAYRIMKSIEREME